MAVHKQKDGALQLKVGVVGMSIYMRIEVFKRRTGLGYR